jgi:threonine-phosphate decarboxylase
MGRDSFPGPWDHGGLLPGSRGSREEILDASTTVNPFGPPFRLENLFERVEEEVFSYPDPWNERLNNRIAQRLDIDGDCLVQAPGATALIYRWMETVRPRRLVLFEPLFSEYGHAAEFYRIPVVRVPGRRWLPFLGTCPDSAREWGVETDSFNPLPGDWVVLVNPVNPTGQILSLEEAKTFLERLRRSGGGLLVDESFQDFLETPSSLLKEVSPDNSFLSVLRSMTKVTGLPGIRTGWLAGSRETVRKIRHSLGPWAIGAIESRVLEHYYRVPEWNFQAVQNARNRLSEALVSGGWPVAEGSSPFLFVHTGWGEKAAFYRDKLFRERGVYLRITDGFGPPSGRDYVRLGFQAFRKPHVLEDVFLNWIRSF